MRLSPLARGLVALTAGLCALAPAAAAQAPASGCPAPGTYGPYPAADPAAPVNDPCFARQWGLTQVKAPAAWARGFTGEGVKVAVIDTGVDLDHPDLAGNIGPGLDTLLTPDGCALPDDTEGHGTAVAGIIAARTGNGIGVAGIAPRATILPVQACTRVCDIPAVAAGLDFAVANGAKVVNLSLGYSFYARAAQLYDTAAMHAAIERAWKAGAVVVASAGNEPEPFCGETNGPRVVCVSSTDRRGLPVAPANFPNHFDGGIALRAPGGLPANAVWPPASHAAYQPMPEELCLEHVFSTSDGGGTSSCTGAGGYGGYAGTSFAAPHVSGAAALLAQAGLTNAQIVERLKNRSSNAGRHDPVMGYGILDLDAATQGLTPLPGAQA